jgi:hypothetical protein
VSKLDSWFSGQAIIIKSHLDRATAENYKHAFEKAGAICAVESEMSAKEEAQPMAPPSVSTASQQPKEAEMNFKAGENKRTSQNTKSSTTKRRKNMEERGFFASLFDLSFQEFITPRIIKLLFILAIIGSAIGGLFIFSNGLRMMSFSPIIGIAIMVLSPIVFLLYVLFARMWLEVIMVMFRIAENTSKLVDRDE